MQYIIGLTVFLVAAYILYEVWLISKIKQIWLQKTINIVFTLLIIPACLTLVIPVFQREQIEKEEHFRKTILNAIYEKKTDKSQLDELIESKYREIFNTSEKDARQYVHDLLASLDTKKQDLAALSEKSKELEDAYYSKWKPLFELILTQFDEITAEFQNKGEKLTIETQDNDYKILVDTEKESASLTTIRKVRFQNGNFIGINYVPARIERGVFITRGQLLFNAKTKNRSGFAFQFFLEDKLIWLHSNDPRYKNFNGYQVRTDINPLDDQAFCEQISSIMKKFITNIYLLD